ncbi:MAG: stage V sporulation protein AE [Clostridia bacterium]
MVDGAKSKVIIVTDGDHTAWEAVSAAAADLGLYALPQSRGNPTPRGVAALTDAVRKAPCEPVVVLVDDQGDADTGPGERVLDGLLRAPELQVLGVVAVASHTRGVRGVEPWISVTGSDQRVKGAVDKGGHAQQGRLRGDTVDVLNGEDVPVVGLGDPGKMGGRDAVGRGAPATREALRAILERAGLDPRKERKERKEGKEGERGKRGPEGTEGDHHRGHA